MNIRYFSDTDTLSIRLGPGRAEGQDTEDQGITLFYDFDHRLTEILIEYASTRTSLGDLSVFEIDPERDDSRKNATNDYTYSMQVREPTHPPE